VIVSPFHLRGLEGFLSPSKQRGHGRSSLGFAVAWLCVAVFTCGLALSGCAQPAAVAQHSTPSPGATAEVSVSPAAPYDEPPSEDGPGETIVTLQVWLPPEIARASMSVQGRSLLYIDALAEAAELPKGVRVASITKDLLGPAGMIESALATAPVVPERLPDMMLIDASELQALVSAGLAQPLDGALPTTVWQEIWPSSQEAVMIDGVAFGAPLCVDIPLLIYDVATLAAPPATWGQLLSGDLALLFPAAPAASSSDTILTLYLSEAGHTATVAPQIDTTALTRALSAVQLGREAGRIHADAVETLDVDQSWAAYATDKVDMAVSTSAQLLRGGDSMPTTQIAPIPPSGDAPVSVAHTMAWVVLTTDKQHREPAIELVHASLRDEQQRVLSMRTYHLPAVRSALDANTASPWHGPLTLLLTEAQPAPAVADYDLLNRSLMWATASVLRGQASPAEAANLAAVRVSEQE